MKKRLLLLVLLLQLTTARSQTPSPFEGVYFVEQPEVLLVLKDHLDDFSGYLSDGQQIISLKGKKNKENVLELEAVMNGEVKKSYASLDATGNLLMADEQLNVLYFTRSVESVGRVMQGFEQALQEPASPATPDPSAGAAPEGKSDARYADKKFLHLYTGNGLSEKWAYYLFSDGHFYYRSNTAYLSGDSFTDFSAAIASDKGGTWSVQTEEGTEYLLLNWNSGERGKLSISKTHEGYFLNKTKYFLVGLNDYE